MKHLLLLWAALLLALTVETPAHAAAPVKDAGTGGCFAHYAQWPATDDATLPAGTYTRIQTCTLGGHQIRINSADWPVETYHCGAAGELGTVSVWVDGEKVVSSRDTGLASLCFDSDAKLVSKIIVNDKLHLTVCEALGGTERDTAYKPSELKPGQHNATIQDVDDPDGGNDYFIEECTLTTLKPKAGASDPYFATRTLPGIAQIGNGDAMCPAIEKAFAEPVDMEDKGAYDTTLPSALDAYRTDNLTIDGKPFDSASEDDQAKGRIAHYKFDVDHDGVTDILTFTDKGSDEYPGQYSWTSGKSGKTFAITGTLVGDGIEWTSDDYTDPVREGMTFIAAGGKVWLYVTEIGLVSAYPAYDVTDVERMNGAVDDGTTPYVTRQVYELKPDGTARVTCAWGPRKRPEEFM